MVQAVRPFTNTYLSFKYPLHPTALTRASAIHRSTAAQVHSFLVTASPPPRSTQHRFSSGAAQQTGLGSFSRRQFEYRNWSGRSHPPPLQSSISATVLAVGFLASVTFSIAYSQFADLYAPADPPESVADPDDKEGVEAKQSPGGADDEEDLLFLQDPPRLRGQTTENIYNIPFGASYYAHMANYEIKQGWPGNLTPEQEGKLREMWWQLSRLVGITEGRVSVDNQSIHSGEEKKKGGFLRRAPTSGSDATANDKYGQKADYFQAIAEQTPEQMRRTIWSFMKADEPDSLLCRFLRARKWDVNKALVMLVSTVRWRGKITHLDDQIIKRGEEYYAELENSTIGGEKTLGKGFMFQYRANKAFLHGTDKLGRPICCVHVRKHKAGDQKNDALEQFIIFQIETTRMMLRPPVDTAMVIFDMSGFGMANMDYVPLKFMIKIFEANYPESLGQICVHNAPWIFNSLWNVIKGWLDPVVASKIVFTKGVDGLSEYIDRNKIPKVLGGDEDWENVYVEPVPGENKIMQDKATHDRLQAERWTYVEEYEKATLDWALSEGKDEKAQSRRMAIFEKLRLNYWELDPYVRARTHFDRIGVLQPGGLYQPYPKEKPEYYIKQMMETANKPPQAQSQRHFDGLAEKENATKRMSTWSTISGNETFYDALEELPAY